MRKRPQCSPKLGVLLSINTQESGYLAREGASRDGCYTGLQVLAWKNSSATLGLPELYVTRQRSSMCLMPARGFARGQLPAMHAAAWPVARVCSHCGLQEARPHCALLSRDRSSRGTRCARAGRMRHQRRLVTAAAAAELPSSGLNLYVNTNST